MCVIIYKPLNVPLTEDLHKATKKAISVNRDGCGYVIRTEKELIYNRGINSNDIVEALIKDLNTLESPCEVLFHARIATCGSVKNTNCHPFTNHYNNANNVISSRISTDVLEKEKIVFMAHNGSFFKHTIGADDITDSFRFMKRNVPDNLSLLFNLKTPDFDFSYNNTKTLFLIGKDKILLNGDFVLGKSGLLASNGTGIPTSESYSFVKFKSNYFINNSVDFENFNIYNTENKKKEEEDEEGVELENNYANSCGFSLSCNYKVASLKTTVHNSSKKETNLVLANNVNTNNISTPTLFDNVEIKESVIERTGLKNPLFSSRYLISNVDDSFKKEISRIHDLTYKVNVDETDIMETVIKNYSLYSLCLDKENILESISSNTLRRLIYSTDRIPAQLNGVTLIDDTGDLYKVCSVVNEAYTKVKLRSLVWGNYIYPEVSKILSIDTRYRMVRYLEVPKLFVASFLIKEALELPKPTLIETFKYNLVKFTKFLKSVVNPNNQNISFNIKLNKTIKVDALSYILYFIYMVDFIKELEDYSTLKVDFYNHADFNQNFVLEMQKEYYSIKNLIKNKNLTTEDYII